jgi:undecaprenyl-diphosphatase
VPTILAASAYDLWKMRSLLSGQIQNIELLVTGSVVAFFSALIVIKWLIHFLQKNTLEGFGWYRLMLATLMFLLYYREI